LTNVSRFGFSALFIPEDFFTFRPLPGYTSWLTDNVIQSRVWVITATSFISLAIIFKFGLRLGNLGCLKLESIIFAMRTVLYEGPRYMADNSFVWKKIQFSLLLLILHTHIVNNSNRNSIIKLVVICTFFESRLSCKTTIVVLRICLRKTIIRTLATNV
jgi:hypothetical protein